MALKPEKFGEILSPKPKTAEEAFESYKKEGRYDFSKINAKEWPKVWELYKENFDLLDGGERTEIFEQILHLGIVEEGDVLKILSQFAKQERVMIGAFVARSLENDKYNHLFYETWKDFDWELRHYFRGEFLAQYPHKVLLVAPLGGDVMNLKRISEDSFKNIRKKFESSPYILKEIESSIKALPKNKFVTNPWKLIEPAFKRLDKKIGRIRKGKGPDYPGWMHDWAKRPQKIFEELKLESIFDVYLNNFEKAKKLFDSYLWMADRAKSKTEVSVEDEMMHDDLRRFFDEMAVRFSKTNFIFVLPYFIKAVESGLMRRERAHEIVGEFLNGDRWFGSNHSFYINESENQKHKEIIEKARQFNPSMKEKEVLWGVEEFPVAPGKLVYEEKLLHSEAEDRALRHAFSNFKDFKKVFLPQDEDKLMTTVIDNNFPLFAAVDLLGFNNAKVKSLLFRAFEQEGNNLASDMNDLRDTERLIKAGYYKEVVDIFVLSLPDLESMLADKIVYNAEKILPLFEQKDRDKIIALINEHSPASWFKRLDYVLEHKPISLKTLLLKASDNLWMFLGHYSDIAQYLSMKENRDEMPDEETVDLKAMARKLFEENPEYLFQFAKTFLQVFSKDEQTNFILGNMKNDASRDFIGAVAGELGRNFSGTAGKIGLPRYDLLHIKNEAHAFIVKHIDVVLDAITGPNATFMDWDGFKYLFPTAERFQSMIRYLSKKQTIDFSGVFFENFVIDLAGNDLYFDKFIEMLAKKPDIAPWGKLLEVCEVILRRDMGARRIKENNVLLLTEAARENLKRGQEMAINYLVHFCQNAKFSIFDLDIGTLRDERLLEIVKREIEEYAGIDIGILNDSDRGYNKNKKLDVIFYNLVNNFWRWAIFSPSSYVDREKVSLYEISNIKDLVKMRWDFMERSKQELKEDYYVKAIKELSSIPFFKLYEKTLRDFSSAQLAKYGERKNLRNFKPPEEFIKIFDRILLLNSSELVAASESVILNLGEKDREEILNFLDYILLHNLDDQDRFKEAINKLSVDTLDGKKDLEAIAFDHLSKIFRVNIGEWGVRGVGLDMAGLQALSIFYSNTKENVLMREGLRRLLKEGLSGNYNEWRAWGVDETEQFKKADLFDVLKSEKLLPQGLSLNQYDNWLKDNIFSLEEVLDFSIDDTTRGIRSVLYQAIADHHIEEDQLDFDFSSAKAKYDLITLPMQEWTDRLGVLKRKIEFLKKSKSKERLTREEEGEYKDLQNQIAEYRKEKEEALRLAEGQMYLAKLRHVTLDELSGQALKIENKSLPFRKVFEILEKTFAESSPDFYQDILRISGLLTESFKNMFGEGRISKSVLRIQDTVDAGTYLKIGEEPVPSCQSYKSKSGYNLGLLSYVIDPNVKIIQVHDESDKIIARSIMRLLSDKDNNPQLFIERIYSVNAHRKIREAIVNFAKNKAKSLGVRLFSHNIEFNEIVPEEAQAVATLHSDNSRAPFVYTDAGGGKRPKGEYIIRGAFRII